MMSNSKYFLFKSRWAHDTKFIYSEKATKIWQNLPVLLVKLQTNDNIFSYFSNKLTFWENLLFTEKLEKLKLHIAYNNLYSTFAYRSGRTSRGAQVFERFGCAVDSERKFKAHYIY